MSPPRVKMMPLVLCVNAHRCGNSLRSWSRSPLCRECVERTRQGPILRTDTGEPISIRDYLRERRAREQGS